MSKKEAIKKKATLENEADKAIFQKLRAYRLSIAKELNIAPFIIFHDSTLIEIAKVKPENLEQFASISGVGQTKLERYGSGFLEVIVNHP